MFTPVTTAVMARRAQAAEWARNPLNRIGLGERPLPIFKAARHEPHKTIDALQDYVFEQLLIELRSVAKTEVYMAEQALKVFGSFGALR